MILGYDPEHELKLLWKAGIVAGLWANTYGWKHVPALKVRQSKVKPYTSGRAYSNHRIVVTVAKNEHAGGFLGVLAHEAAHLLCPANVHHDPEFWACLVSLIQARWGIIIDLSSKNNGIERQREIHVALGTLFGVLDYSGIENHPTNRIVEVENDPSSEPCLPSY